MVTCWSSATCAIGCVCAPPAIRLSAPTSCRCSSRAPTNAIFDRHHLGECMRRQVEYLSMRATFAIAVLTGIVAFAARAADAPEQPARAAESRAVMSVDQVVQILDETVDWYRTLGAQQQAATQPSDLLILYANRQTADKVVALAFEIARANAELLSSEAGVKQEADEGACSQSVGRLRKRLDEQRRSIQAEIEATRRQVASAPKQKQST